MGTDFHEAPTKSPSAPTYSTVDSSSSVITPRNDQPISHHHTSIQFTEDDIIIAVMGLVGAGKSTFVNMATQQTAAVVGHGLGSCTKIVQAVSCPHPDDIRKNVVFVDTPGFDDTDTEDDDVLAQIARWLTKTHGRQIKLAGLLYFHRISDNRIGGTPLKNFDMFQKLCGTDALQNVILATTMWDLVDEKTGNEREEELRTRYWRSMIDFGSQVARFRNTYESAWEIVRRFKGRPQVLPCDRFYRRNVLRRMSAALMENLVGYVHSFKVRLCNLPNRRKREDEANGECKHATARPNEQKRKFVSLPKIMTGRSSTAVARPSSTSLVTRSGTIPRISRSPEPHSASKVETHYDPLLPPVVGGHQTPRVLGHRGQELIANIYALQNERHISTVPFLKSGVQQIIAIAKSINAMEPAERSLITLTHNAGWLLIAISEQVRTAEISDEMRETVEHLVKDLKEVQNVIRQVTSRGAAYRYAFRPAEEQVLYLCNQTIQRAYDHLDLQATGINQFTQ